jgi:branched-chain amino acid transport system ATP-binding protein
MSGPLLQIEGLTRRYGGLAAVQDVSFAVPAGVIAAVIGPNGAGKTTLFNLISGFTPPNEGRVMLDGQVLTGLRADQVAARGLVRTFQLVRLFPQMTALGNVLVGFHMHSKGGSLAAIVRPRWLREQEVRIRGEAWGLLGLVGLQHQADTLANNLTYGQQRLLEIARGLAAQPKLIMLDEPAAGLNAEERKTLGTLLRLLRGRGMTILLVEHNVPFVTEYCDELVLLEAGAVTARARLDAPLPERLDAYLKYKPTLAGEA